QERPLSTSAARSNRSERLMLAQSCQACSRAAILKWSTTNLAEFDFVTAVRHQQRSEQDRVFGRIQHSIFSENRFRQGLSVCFAARRQRNFIDFLKAIGDHVV